MTDPTLAASIAAREQYLRQARRIAGLLPYFRGTARYYELLGVLAILTVGICSEAYQVPSTHPEDRR